MVRLQIGLKIFAVRQFLSFCELAFTAEKIQVLRQINCSCHCYRAKLTNLRSLSRTTEFRLDKDVAFVTLLALLVTLLGTLEPEELVKFSLSVDVLVNFSRQLLNLIRNVNTLIEDLTNSSCVLVFPTTSGTKYILKNN